LGEATQLRHNNTPREMEERGKGEIRERAEDDEAHRREMEIVCGLPKGLNMIGTHTSSHSGHRKFHQRHDKVRGTKAVTLT
jgi:hypothetical protein